VAARCSQAESNGGVEDKSLTYVEQQRVRSSTRNSTERLKMPKWEYCVVSGMNFDRSELGFSTFYPRLIFFDSRDGIRWHKDIQRHEGGETEALTVARLIAELGDAGWELVSSGISGVRTTQMVPSRHFFLFKRLKEE
jgi:hypothetical protein